MANNPLPQAQRLRAVRVYVRRGARGRHKVEVHLSVRVDVVPRTKRPRKTPLVAGADMGCAHTVTLHNARTLSLPDHGPTLERALATQGRMNACVKGSRKWRDERETMRAAHATMQVRDRDAIRKFAAWLARHFDVAGFESLQIKTMTESGREDARRRRRRAGATAQSKHPQSVLESDTGCSRRCARSPGRTGLEASRHGLERDLRGMRAHRRGKPQGQALSVHRVRARERRRCERRTHHASTNTSMA